MVSRKDMGKGGTNFDKDEFQGGLSDGDEDFHL